MKKFLMVTVVSLTPMTFSYAGTDKAPLYCSKEPMVNVTASEADGGGKVVSKVMSNLAEWLDVALSPGGSKEIGYQRSGGKLKIVDEFIRDVLDGDVKNGRILSYKIVYLQKARHKHEGQYAFDGAVSYRTKKGDFTAQITFGRRLCDLGEV